jgi:hypothetical protein
VRCCDLGQQVAGVSGLQCGVAVAGFEVLDLGGHCPGEVDVKDLGKEGVANHDVGEFSAEGVGAVPARLV